MSPALNAPIQSVSRILEAEGIIDVGAIEDDQDQEFRGVVDASPPPAEAPQPERFAVEMPLRPFSLTGSRSVSGPTVTRPAFTQQTSTTASPDSNRSYRSQPDSAVGTAAAPPVSQIFHFGQTLTAPAATTPPIYNAFSAEYLRILNNVIFAARSRSFPEIRSSRTRQSGERISTPASNSRLPPGSDEKIGAAGELFVYELLSHLNPSLTGFGMCDWRSTMRKHVAVHPEYSYVTPWEGKETADIIYDDNAGVLTRTLIDKGYLEGTHWITYMLIRVFNLTTSDIDLDVYMDPYALQQDGSLIFAEHTWHVVPA
ncbi:hypothetical protein CSAL01_12171 [Colletotrichum salicis]|uniref:Uncharacterized protein n=1 Tax=Colletotrichum salicis TaxID=1209931 RepID=A0A135T5H8_9PEZI|nr:hypothetical protein CSAL01_12171 [Colletotrichum salicis]